MTSKAALLLRNLLARLDADAATEKPQFRGVVSDAERDALRSLLEDAGNSPIHSLPEAVQESAKHRPPATRSPAVTLNTEASRLDTSPKPHWTLCLDFGTAKSKAFAASDDEDEPKLSPLPVGKADEDLDGSVHEVSSSVWIDDNGLLFVGSEAIKRGMVYGDPSRTTRRRLDSLKQEISQVRPEDGAA